MLKPFQSLQEGPWSTSGIDVQYRIECIDNVAHLYFQCTSSDSDWKHNFDFMVKPYKNMKETWFAHRGFVALWHSVRDDILTKLKDFPTVRVYGYSLGAALATLAYEDLKFHGKSVKGDVYASPRVIWMPNERIQYIYNDFFRYQVSGDLVCHVPPFFFGYKHVGIGIILGPKSFLTHKNHYPDVYLKYLQERR